MSETFGELIEQLRAHYDVDRPCILIRPGGYAGFIESTPAEAKEFIDHFERMALAGQTLNPLEKLGALLLLSSIGVKTW